MRRPCRTRDDPERRLVRRIGDQILANDVEAQKTRCEIGSRMTCLRKPGQRFESLEQLLNEAVRAASGFSPAMYDRISSISVNASGWSANELMHGGAVPDSAASATAKPLPARWPRLRRSGGSHSGVEHLARTLSSWKQPSIASATSSSGSRPVSAAHCWPSRQICIKAHFHASSVERPPGTVKAPPPPRHPRDRRPPPPVLHSLVPAETPSSTAGFRSSSPAR